MQYTEELGMPERQIVRFSTRKLSLVEIWRESLNLLRLRDFAAARRRRHLADAGTSPTPPSPRRTPHQVVGWLVCRGKRRSVRATRTACSCVRIQNSNVCALKAGWLAAALLRSIESTRDEFLGISPLAPVLRH